MYRHHHWLDDQESVQAANRQTASLASIVVILLLLICGLFLVQQLRTASTIQDCIMAGRMNCDALVMSQR